MKIQILIKHYLFSDLTDYCIKSLLKSYLHNADLLVIDSSNDYDNPLVDVKTISNDIGLIESFNRFINPEYDLILCLNNDTFVHTRWLSEIIQCIENDPKIGIIAPMYDQPGSGDMELLCPYKPDQYTNWLLWLNNNLKFGQVKYTRHVDNCVWGFTNDMVDEVGLPDGSFPGAGWGANLDYCYRARQSNYKVAVALGSFIHHNHRGTYGKIDPNYVQNAEKQRDNYLLEKYGRTDIVW